MCTIHKSGTQAINFRLSLRRFWRPLQMRKRTMSNIIKVFPQKRCDSSPKLTMDRLPCHKRVIQGHLPLFFPWQPAHEDDVVICSDLFIRNLCPFRMTTVYSQPVTVFSLTLYFHLTRIFRAMSSRYYIPIRLFIRDIFFQLSPSCASALRTNGIEFSNSFDW